MNITKFKFPKLTPAERRELVITVIQSAVMSLTAHLTDSVVEFIKNKMHPKQEKIKFN